MHDELRDRTGTQDVAPFVPLQLAMPHTNISQLGAERDMHSLFIEGSWLAVPVTYPNMKTTLFGTR